MSAGRSVLGRCYYICGCGHRFRSTAVRGLDRVRCPACGAACGTGHVAPPLKRGGVVYPKWLTKKGEAAKLAAGRSLGDDALEVGAVAPTPFPAQPDQFDSSGLTISENLPTMRPPGAPRTLDEERTLRWYLELNGYAPPLPDGIAAIALRPPCEARASHEGPVGHDVAETTAALRELPGDVQQPDPLLAAINFRLSRAAELETGIILAAERVVVAWRGNATAGGWAMSENLRTLDRLLQERSALSTSTLP